MRSVTLTYLADRLAENNIAYELNEWTGRTMPKVFTVGTYTEQPFDMQSGKQVIDFTLTAEAVNGTWNDLQALRDRIMRLFVDHRAVLSDGTLLAILYQTASPIPSAAYNVKRLEIKIKITEWSVMKNV